MWFPPARWQSTTWENLRQTPAWIGVFGRQLTPAGRLRTYMEAHHRELPEHWYLLYLGTEPARQGQGVGSDLPRPVLRNATAAGQRPIPKPPASGTGRCTPGMVSSAANPSGSRTAARSRFPCGGSPAELWREPG